MFFHSLYLSFFLSFSRIQLSPSQQQLSTGSALLDNVFGRPWSVECENIRLQSPYRNVKGWKLASFIIKAGEDIRREALVMQCMTKLWTWFQEEIPPHLRPYLRPYTIMCVGGDAGIVECLPDVKSVNEVKKETDGFTTLLDFFVRAYGPPVQPPLRPDRPNPHYGAVSFEKARDNFLRSLVGYSVVCYILQIKDRHNANILMDREGHIMVSRKGPSLVPNSSFSAYNSQFVAFPSAHRFRLRPRRITKDGQGPAIQRARSLQAIGRILGGHRRVALLQAILRNV